MAVPAEESRRRFARLYDEHIWDVYGFFGYRLRSREEVEDLTQQTFERALRAWERFDAERATERTWLLAIARNLLIDHYRRRGSAAHEPLDESDGEDPRLESRPGPEEALGLAPELESALGSLGERERELIALRFGADLNGPEIAELTGLTLANVHQILSRSLRRLRGKLDPDAARSEAI